jgi:hypothetical protein
VILGLLCLLALIADNLGTRRTLTPDDADRVS